MTPLLPPDSPVSTTVYSVVWPDTEALVRACLTQDTDLLLERHRQAHLKSQDGMHLSFFEAWRTFAEPAVSGLDQFPEMYPCNGSSEAIREIIHEAAWQEETLIVFEGEYEGYEAIAQAQGTPVLRVARERWRETLQAWLLAGPPWRKAQWWISQPSALDGNPWEDFHAWLDGCQQFPGLRVWVDLTYVGRARLTERIFRYGVPPVVAGIVFSLSKVMGAYYRRIGGCLARQPVQGLWANRWFKHLDSLLLGERWLQAHSNALEEGQRYALLQRQALDRALDQLDGAGRWRDAGVHWQASAVPLLMHARTPGRVDLSRLTPLQQQAWQAAGRGPEGRASRRLCLTPTLCSLLFPSS